MIKHETFKGTKALIINGDKILILVKPNSVLDLPGGRLETNETFTHCIRREVFEETSLSVLVSKPVAFWSFVKNGTGLKINGVTYLCRCLDSTVRLGKEHKSFFWVDAKDLLRFKFYPSYGLDQFSQERIGRWQENVRFWSLPQIK
jgi:ADP-ribose pyrophosphatase YjhB (NUDIX family)